jgi:hypothetical protein
MWPKDIPVTPQEEEYWQEIGQRIDVVNISQSLFTTDQETWEGLLHE